MDNYFLIFGSDGNKVIGTGSEDDAANFCSLINLNDNGTYYYKQIDPVYNNMVQINLKDHSKIKIFKED